MFRDTPRNEKGGIVQIKRDFSVMREKVKERLVGQRGLLAERSDNPVPVSMICIYTKPFNSFS